MYDEKWDSLKSKKKTNKCGNQKDDLGEPSLQLFTYP
jgi:hypothetical protein